MKNLFLAVAILVSTASFAQYDHNIQFANGSTATQSLAEIDSISFSNDGMPMMRLNLVNGGTDDYGLGLINQIIFQGSAEGIIGSLDCGSATINGTLAQGVSASGVSFSIPYNAGNGGTYNGQTVQSSGVNGLTAILTPGTFANGNGTLTFAITGTPQSSGTASFTINIGGQTCTLTIEVNLPVGSISSLNCGSATVSGTLTQGETASGVSVSIPYTGGNGGTHNGQTVESSGVTGLTVTLAPGTFANGGGTLTYNITGTAQSSGSAVFPINTGEQTCVLTLEVHSTYSPSYPTGTTHCSNGGSKVIEVINPATGKIWMDRNLGASQVAAAANDEAAYGDLYQWGRFSDGHQCRNSETTSTNATTAAPNQGNSWDGKFIPATSSPWDWLSSQNNNLWQGVNGINNPCPEGYRLPTDVELNDERGNWSSNNSAGAFDSPLKLPATGFRHPDTGGLLSVGSVGRYRSSTVLGTFARTLYVGTIGAQMLGSSRASGYSVRCLKD